MTSPTAQHYEQAIKEMSKDCRKYQRDSPIKPDVFYTGAMAALREIKQRAQQLANAGDQREQEKLK